MMLFLFLYQSLPVLRRNYFFCRMGSDFDVNTTQVSENANHSQVDINVDINATGDSPISQENAELVADLLAERINKELGGKI